MFEQRLYTDIQYNHAENIYTGYDNGNLVKAYCTPIDKLNVAEIHAKISTMQNEGVTHIILVYNNTPTPTVKTVISNTQNIGLTIELFNAEDLAYNPTKHTLVPLHERLPKDETKVFKERFGKDIPIILRSDPIARFYNFTKGDVIKITRRNGFISYRIVK
jgi:DNA-directed RNA polymerase subunit H (RpoH/RPB5)